MAYKILRGDNEPKEGSSLPSWSFNLEGCIHHYLISGFVWNTLVTSPDEVDFER